MKNIAVLASGNGSNLQAIIEAINRNQVAAHISLVISDNPESGAINRARKNGIKHLAITPGDFNSRVELETGIINALKEDAVELVVLAGFMRVLSSHFIDAFPRCILNIHPSLLPAFPGLNAVSKALEYGVKVSGCTVHFVDQGIDTGPIVLQEAVPVLQSDSEETLHERIHAAEHRCYPRAVDMFCRDKIKVIGRRCYLYD